MKLHCTHWVVHAQPMLAEGLDKSPLNVIAANVAKAGFNCVRLSYATYMFTRHANNTVRDTFHSYDVPEMVTAIQKHNPSVLNMTHLQAYEAVVDALGAHGVMVLIDNHLSLPDWCCANDDQNGFFGDRHFNTSEWIQGLAIVAHHFKGKPNVSNLHSGIEKQIFVVFFLSIIKRGGCKIELVSVSTKPFYSWSCEVFYNWCCTWYVGVRHGLAKRAKGFTSKLECLVQVRERRSKDDSRN